MPWPSCTARSRARPRCEPLEGRVLLAASLDYPRLDSAMQNAVAPPPFLAFGPSPPLRSLDLDLDGDGLLDRVALSRLGGADRLDVFRGLKSGGLETVRQTALGHVAASVLANDFDGDGRPDLFAAGETPGQGTLLLSRGGWGFEAYQRGTGNVALAVGDLSGDGRDDYVFANPALDRVVVDVTGLGKTLLADGPAGALAPDMVHLADLDGDGLLDLLVCTGAGLLVYPGLGDGRFGDEVGTDLGLAGVGPARVTVAFLDDRGEFNPQSGGQKDPYLDLIVTNVGEGTVSVFLGEGGWRMRPLGPLWAGPAPSSVLPRDVTGDGVPDLVVTSPGTGSVWILPGLGGGRFDDRSPRVLAAGLLPLMSFVADFDGDRRPDLAVVNAGSDDVTLYPDVASGSTEARWFTSGGDGPVAALLRDVNGDGLGDLVVAHRGDGRLSLLVGGPDGLTLRETVVIPNGRPAALAPSPEPWKVYVAAEDGEDVALVSFTPPAVTHPEPELDGQEGDAPPVLDVPEPEAQPRLEPPSAGAVGLFPTLVTPLYGDAADDPLPDPGGEEEQAEAAVTGRSKAAAANLSGGGAEEEEEGAEPGEPVAAVTAEQAVQRFLLGVDDAPPPAVAADGSTEPPRVTEESATPLSWAEDEPPPELPPAPAEGPEADRPVAGPPDEDATFEALLLLAALAVVRDRPAAGRRGDRAAW